MWKHIEINIWKACNHKCIFCISWMTKNKVLWFESYETIVNEIKSFKDKGYTSLWFLWWEPTIHPKFLDFVLFAKDVWFENIEVISNGSKFDDKKFLNNAVKNGLSRISISFHSVDEDEEAILTWGISWIVRKKMKALVNILDLYRNWYIRREVSINIVISKLNYKSIKKTILTLYKLWVKSFRLNFIQLEGYSTLHYNILALRYEDFQEELSHILSLCRLYKDLKINFEAIPWCFTGLNYQTFIRHSEQKVDKQKDKVSRDDINLTSRDVIHQLGRRKELKRYLKKCDTCFLKKDCEWIWARYLKHFQISPNS